MADDGWPGRMPISCAAQDFDQNRDESLVAAGGGLLDGRLELVEAGRRSQCLEHARRQVILSSLCLRLLLGLGTAAGENPGHRRQGQGTSPGELWRLHSFVPHLDR